MREIERGRGREIRRERRRERNMKRREIEMGREERGG